MVNRCGVCWFEGEPAAYIPHDCYWVLRERGKKAMNKSQPPPGVGPAQHDWMDKQDPRMARWPSLRDSMRPDYAMCYRCGVIRRADDKNKPCSGKMPKITLREESNA